MLGRIWCKFKSIGGNQPKSCSLAIKSTSSMSKRKAQGPGRSGKAKLPQVVWASGHPPSSSSGAAAQPTVRVQNTTYSVGPSGGASTRRSYVTTAASPKETRAESPDPVFDWNVEPPVDATAGGDLRDEDWVDADYQEHIDAVHVVPKKRKRTIEVSL